MQIRVGAAVRMEGELYLILDAKHTHRGRGGATITVKLKNLATGAVQEITVRDPDALEEVFLERKPAQYSYNTGETYHFYDTTTFEEIAFSRSQIEDLLPFLKEGMEVTLLYADGRPVAVEPPNFVELEVVETPPGVKGDTVSGGGKPATLETGLVVQVPFFVEVGDVVRVDTRTRKYIERVRKGGGS